MGIQAKKLLSRICRFMDFVALLLIMVAIGVGGNGEEQDPLLAHLMDSEEISQEMAELLQINCRNELLHAQKTLQDPESCSMMTGRFSHNVNVVKGKSSRTQMHDNTGYIWCPQVKQILLDCMVKKNLMLHIPAVERDLDTWYTRYLGSLHYASERRELGEKKKGKKAKKKEEDSSSSPIVAIAAASVTLAIAMVLFCFFCKCCMADSELNKNDESPLLTLSLSDKYVASQQKSLSRGTSMCEEKHETPLGITSMTSANSEADPNQMPLAQPTSVQSGPLGAHGIAPLRPPPGRASTNLSMPLPVTASSPESSLPTQPGAPPNRTSSSGPLPLPPGALRPFQTPGAAELPAPPGADELLAPPGSLGAPGLPPPPGEPGQPPPLPPGVPGQPLPPGVPGQPPPPLPPGAPGPPLPAGASGPPPPPGIVGGPPPPPPAGRGGGPPPPPPPGGRGGGPPPPPGLGGRGGGPPPPPGPGGPRAPPPLGKRPPRRGGSQDGDDDSSAASKAKLKPFFWDKVNANDNTMVWNQISAGSFQFNEEMMESLFGYSNVPKGNAGGKKESLAKENMPQFIQIIDPKKAQNLSIMLKALNVTTEEVCDALEEGNELPSELIQTLIKMAPTTEEELKLRIYNGDLALLGPAERFLKRLVDIPFPFKRLETLLFMCSLQEDMTSLKESFKVLEVSCTELRKCRVFLKLLEAVLKTGNRMNDGTYRGGAQAFKLDTLLKLSDVKGVDGKTTLLHFVVLEIIRTEGIRSARASREMRSMSSFNSDDLLESPLQDSDELLKSLGLQIVSTVGDDLKNVKKAASMDADGLTGTVSRIGFSLKKAKDFLSSEMKSIDENNGFHQTLKSFVENASPDIQWALEEEKRIMAMVKSTTDFFHGSTGKDEGLRLFVIVRDFLIILDKICKELKSSQVMLNPAKKEQPAAKPQPPDPKTKTAVDPKPPNLPPIPNQQMSALINRRPDSSSSSSSDDD